MLTLCAPARFQWSCRGRMLSLTSGESELEETPSADVMTFTITFLRRRKQVHDLQPSAYFSSTSSRDRKTRSEWSVRPPACADAACRARSLGRWATAELIAKPPLPLARTSPHLSPSMSWFSTTAPV